MVRLGLLVPLESQDLQEEEECQDLMDPEDKREVLVTEEGWEDQDQKATLEMLGNLALLAYRV